MIYLILSRQWNLPYFDSEFNLNQKLIKLELYLFCMVWFFQNSPLLVNLFFSPGISDLAIKYFIRYFAVSAGLWIWRADYFNLIWELNYLFSCFPLLLGMQMYLAECFVQSHFIFMIVFNLFSLHLLSLNGCYFRAIFVICHSFFYLLFL